MKKKGFTLVELLAAISILAIIGLLAVPNVIKSYNKSKINAITIQENKLVEAGDILLDDYCKDAISDEYKEQCKIYYQELDEGIAQSISTEKDYKYICVEDIKSLEYYTEELKFGGTPCQGVVIYELDKQTKLQTNSFSYLKCGEDYNTGQGMDTEIPLDPNEVDYISLFSNCFDDISTGDDHENNKKYTLTIKFVENDLNGNEVKPTQKILLTNSDYDKTIKAEFTVPKHSRGNNTYESVINTGGKEIEFENLYPTKDANGNKTYKIKKLPKENVTITVVYSVEKHSIVTNYYKFDPSYSYGDTSTGHINFGKMSKAETKVTGYTLETKTLDAPETLTETINGKSEVFNRYLVYVDNAKKENFSGILDVGLEDKTVDVIYQRDSFNITYNNNGGTGCSTGTVKYNGAFNNLCTPTRSGYTFEYWKNSSGESVSNGTKYETYSDLTLTAVWTAHKFTFVFNGNNNSGGSVASLECTYDQECKLPNNSFTRTGHTFTNWYLDSNGTGTSYPQGYNAKNYTTENGKTINLYAGWSVNTYYIAFASGTGGSGTMGKMTMNYTDVKNLTANSFTKTGHSFANWSGSDGNTYTDQQEVKRLTTVAGETITMTAQWGAKTYTVTFDANGGNAPSKTSMDVTYDSTYGTLATTSRPGYTFKGWYTAASGGTKIDSSTKVTITSNQTLYAHWNEHTYYIVFSPGTNGSGTMDKMTMKYAESKKISNNAFIRTGYKFKNWVGSDGKTYANEQEVKKLTTTNSATITMTANWEAIDVKYVVNHYKQKINAPDEKNTTNYELEEKEELKEKSDVTKKISVKTYTGFTSPSEKEVTIKPDGTTVVNYYYYKRNKYTLTLELEDDEIISVTGGCTYHYGASISIKATPSTYHNFEKWTLSETTISTTAEYEYKMPNKNVTLKAYGKNAKLAQALYIKEKEDNNPYSLIFINTTTHYKKDDTYTYTTSSVEKKELLVQAVYKNFINDDYESEEKVDWVNIAPFVEVVQVHSG